MSENTTQVSPMQSLIDQLTELKTMAEQDIKSGLSVESYRLKHIAQGQCEAFQMAIDAAQEQLTKEQSYMSGLIKFCLEVCGINPFDFESNYQFIQKNFKKIDNADKKSI